MQWLKVFINLLKRIFGMKPPFKILIQVESDDFGNPLPDQEKKYCVAKTKTNEILECYSNIEDAKKARDVAIEEEKKKRVEKKIKDIRDKSLSDHDSESTPKKDS